MAKTIFHHTASHVLRGVMLLNLLLGFAYNAAAELIFTAPPRETEVAGQALYGPIAEHLSTVLGDKVTYEHPKNWLSYQHDMRKGKYDIVFDGPHFMSWRMANLGANPVVKLPGELLFYLVARADDDTLNGLDDIIAKPVCGIAPPNLATLSVLAEMKNPVRQPVLVPIKGGFGVVHKAFKEGKCRAAIMRSTFYDKKLSAEDRASSKVIYKSRPFPNQGITVSQQVGVEQTKLLIQSLTTLEGATSAKNLLSRFGGKATAFIPANKEEYQGHNKLLEDVIFGW